MTDLDVRFAQGTPAEPAQAWPVVDAGVATALVAVAQALSVPLDVQPADDTEWALPAAQLQQLIDAIAGISGGAVTLPDDYPLPLDQLQQVLDRLGTIEEAVTAQAFLTRTQLDETPVAVEVDFPDVQAVSGTVTAEVDFPDVQAVSGTVTAEVEFPDTQAVSVEDEIDVADSGEREYTPVTELVENAGPTVLHTPAPGKRIRLRWIYAVNDPTSSAAPLIRVLLGGQEKYLVYALSKRQKVTGPIDGSLVIDLSTAASVAVTALIEEV